MNHIRPVHQSSLSRQPPQMPCCRTPPPDVAEPGKCGNGTDQSPRASLSAGRTPGSPPPSLWSAPHRSAGLPLPGLLEYPDRRFGRCVRLPTPFTHPSGFSDLFYLNDQADVVPVIYGTPWLQTSGSCVTSHFPPDPQWCDWTRITLWNALGADIRIPATASSNIFTEHHPERKRPTCPDSLAFSLLSLPIAAPWPSRRPGQRICTPVS